MAQLSRPYQVGLLGILLLAGVWLVLLQGHSSSTNSTAASAPVPTVQTVTPGPVKHSTATGAKIYHGSAPGVSGLTKDIAKAEGAVATSQQNAKALEAKSAAASNERAPAGAHTSGAPAAAAAPTKTLAAAPKSTVKPASVKSSPARSHTPAAAKGSSKVAVAAEQKIVEAQLAQGKIAVILFWDPKGAEDAADRRAVDQLPAAHLKIGVSVAQADQVASFGTITRGIQIYGTPTFLIVNAKGQTITLTGLQDAFAIEQAIAEARQAE